ncbi:response regulator transcription factor [Rufibacter glacialis]|uniref:Response regulator transcription factor n=1 Tax=Rufibacter glacialis TaxID=1259555 RepID=A0A5M8QFC5_9BACT|nr:response regulator transcription factor [Rufibacter glacialis]KAA6434737.1 response regulator transcription factor [Rufibacter glacialis]GGK72017.1 DNA-binding response regulator [Rufibacter glacialis]
MKILVIEDEPNVAAFIKRGLQEQTFDVEVAYDGNLGKRLALQNDYQVIIMDIIMPHLSGLDLCRQLRQEQVRTPILLLTALGTTDDIVDGLEAGADDYLSKPFKFKELLARVRALARRAEPGQAKSLLQAGDLQMNLDTKEVVRAGKEINLTAREFALLEYFLRKQGKVLSRVDLLENVWDLHFDLGSNVVDVYVNYLRNKVDKDFPVKLLHTVVGMGYILKGPESK